MKTAISIALLFLLSFHLAGFYLFFSFQQRQAKTEIKQRIKQRVPEAALSLIVLCTDDLDQLQWKDAHEFWYQGQLYDIVRSTQQDQTITFHCISDVQETRLFKNLGYWVERHQEDRDKGTFSVKLIRQMFTMLSPPQVIPVLALTGRRQNTPSIYSDPFHSWIVDTPSPPPKGLV
ncbi:MAG: hypothetical protein IPL49_18650 [Saprospirales bacterium]|nr:hypothetical protein [Saprospirales bacterium]MBK8492843.1 hypothetical protein [Saprospirales bacterium]